MKTNFFSNIKGLPRAGSWKMNISIDADEKMLVSVLLEKEKDGKPIAPMVFNGTADELDEGFFYTIAEPVRQTAELFASLDAHQKSLDRAKQEIGDKAKSKPTANASTPPPQKVDDRAEKKRRYDDAIKRATELNSQCKYTDALAELPSNEDYPDKAKELDELRRRLEERQKQMTLL